MRCRIETTAYIERPFSRGSRILGSTLNRVLGSLNLRHVDLLSADEENAIVAQCEALNLDPSDLIDDVEIELAIEVTDTGSCPSHWHPGDPPDWEITSASRLDTGDVINLSEIKLTGEEESRIHEQVCDRIAEWRYEAMEATTYEP